MKPPFQPSLQKDWRVANLLINPLTKRRLDAFISQGSQALLLTGALGTGLQFIAQYLTAQLIVDKTAAESLLNIVPNEKNTISIDEVRALQKRLKLHNRSNGEVSIAIIIESIEAMQTEAQNALLKLLEEPPSGVLFLLLCHDTSGLLKTISSRCVCVDVLPVSLDSAQEFFHDTSAELRKQYVISGGLPGLFVSMVSNQNHPVMDTINTAKKILTATTYERMKQIDSQFKPKETVPPLLDALLRVCSAGLHSTRAPERWTHDIQLLLTAKKQLAANVQSKLVLANLFLNLR